MFDDKNNIDLIIRTKPNLETINNEEQIQKLDLFSHFLTKESRINNFSDKKALPLKNDIMPEYSSIRKQINKKIKDVKSFYNIKNSIFKEMQSKNTFVLNNFRKGFLKHFFGPRGIVTEKNKDLNNFYESLGLKIGLNTQIYAGSLDYYDFLSKYNSYFERLKTSRKSILRMSDNIAIADTALEKMHAIYMENQQKKKLKKNHQTHSKKKINTKLNKYYSNNKKSPNNSKKKMSLLKTDDNSLKNKDNSKKVKKVRIKSVSSIKTKEENISMNKEIENIEAKEDIENDEFEKNDIKNFIECYIRPTKSKSTAKLDRNSLVFKINNIDLSPTPKNKVIKTSDNNKDSNISDRSRNKFSHVSNNLTNFSSFLYQNQTTNNNNFSPNKEKNSSVEKQKLKTNNYYNTYYSKYDRNKMKQMLKNKIDTFITDLTEAKKTIFNDNDKNKNLKTSIKSRKNRRGNKNKSIFEEFKEIDDEKDLKLAKIDPKAESIVSPYLNVQNKKKYENCKRNSIITPLKIYNSNFFDKENDIPVTEYLKKYIEQKNYKTNKATGEKIRKKFKNNCRRIFELGYSLDNAKRMYKIKNGK